MPALEQQSDVLQQFARGELGAFESLFRQYQGEVYRWVVRIVRDPAAAEDLTVETFWRIFRAHARFDPKRNFGGWARRIATNVALDHLKSARLSVPLEEDPPAGAVQDPAIQQSLRQCTERAFSMLPAKLQSVVTLALIEERSYQEIADALGISVGAVKVRVFRAVRMMRKQLKQMGVEP